MAEWQLSYVTKEKAETSDSGTLYIELPKNEQISMLMLEFSCNNTSPSSRDYSRTILDVVKNVRVLLEGSKDAYNVEPEVGLGMAYFQSRQMPPVDIRERGATVLRLPVYFGRYPRDTEYLLDTSGYASAVLEVEYELNTTYETTATAKQTVWILRPTSRLSPVGFIRSRILNNYTSSGSAEEKQVDLPVGLDWQRVGFRVFDIDAFNEKVLTDIDLDVDAGRAHIFDGRIEDLRILNDLWYGSQIVGPRYWGLVESGQYVQNIMADPLKLFWSDYGAALSIFNSSAIWSNRHTLTIRDNDGTEATADNDFVVQAIGGRPFSNYVIGEFGEEPYSARTRNEAHIEYTVGAYAALIQTWLQEVVRGVL